MYEIININIGQRMPAKVTTEMLKATIFNALSKDFNLVMKITDVLGKPANFSNGNAWSRTSKINNYYNGKTAICRRFELKPEKKVQCLVFTDRETDTMVHSLQLLIPVKDDVIVMSDISNSDMYFINQDDVPKCLNKQCATFGEYFARNRDVETETMAGPVTVACIEPPCGSYDWPNLQSILYVGEGKTIKVYHTCGGIFTDDSQSFFEIYDGDTLLKSGIINNEPFDVDKDDMENMVDDIEAFWQAYTDMMKQYGVDINTYNYYGVSHM